ncbi:twin-arginine translocase TatA/TatE family subunit [Prevotella sp. PINT]|jgi:twin arginine-targeting protein translocase, TatA/E family|uniref:Sec-independent protein translocase subunit TatA/TatB n=1 Tax=Palleniella intestinalis TaxID=2736291 RepID=UPI0015565639|nr:twin-arginine translocase TatA/TatE family subunit [Palleniella intestinalis]NPD81540.1 twin-arginine translocase TatA/TatE family subunit [Palleniella intestinalis]
MIGTQEIILIALVILLLFGGKKIPELMRGLGKGVRSFKDGVNGIEEPQPDKKEDAATKANSGK